MRVVKMQAWEAPFRSHIDKVRHEEVKLVRIANDWKGFSYNLWFLTTPLMALIVVVTHKSVIRNHLQARAKGSTHCVAHQMAHFVQTGWLWLWSRWRVLCVLCVLCVCM